MRRPLLLVAAGLAAFVLFLVAFLPASVLLRFVPPQVVLSQVSGTAWRGTAGMVTIGGRPFGSLQWNSRPWGLARLELDYALTLQPPGGKVDFDVSVGRGDRIVLSAVRGGFPLAAIDGMLAPAGWQGTAELDVSQLILQSGFPLAADGTIVVRDLTAAGPGGLNIGSFELTLGEGAVGNDAISGRLRDLGTGPMRVRATLELRPDRSYLLSGEVAAGPDANAALSRNLAFLGPPDSLGRRPFTIEGSL